MGYTHPKISTYQNIAKPLTYSYPDNACPHTNWFQISLRRSVQKLLYPHIPQTLLLLIIICLGGYRIIWKVCGWHQEHSLNTSKSYILPQNLQNFMSMTFENLFADGIRFENQWKLRYILKSDITFLSTWYIRTHTHTHTHTHIYIYINMHTHLYTYIYTHTDIYIVYGCLCMLVYCNVAVTSDH